MRSDHKIILLSGVFGVLFWIIDSLLDFYIYYEGTLFDLLFREVPAHEVYIRSVAIVSFLGFGILLSRMVNKVNTISIGIDERVKELNCLYDISSIIGKNYSLHETMEKIVDSIYSTWQYTELAGVRIVLDDIHVRSENFTETNIRLSRNIVVNDWHAGFIELCYSDKNTENGDNYLPDEEKTLLSTITENITQFVVRKKAEQRQLESATELRALMDAIPDLIALKDKDGAYIECNQEYARFLGVNKEDIAGKTDYRLMDKELADAFSVKEREIIDRGVLSVEERDIVYVNGGKQQVFEIIRGPIYAPDGSLMGLLFVGRDVTRRKETELDLFRDKELAEESNEIKGKFIANMSHELRTPLNSILGYSDLLTEELYGELNEKQNQFATNIKNSGEHLLELINNILDNSKIESGQMEFEPEKFCLKEAINEILSLIEPIAKTKPIDLITNVDLDDMEIYADKLKIKQIMYNLLGNAVKFTPENGSIHVSSELVNENIQISIADTGIGIPLDEQQTIFKPYKQVTSASSSYHKGTGLGLAIVKQFVEMHGGDIRVESEEGKGSTFTFRIPLDIQSEVLPA